MFRIDSISKTFGVLRENLLKKTSKTHRKPEPNATEVKKKNEDLNERMNTRIWQFSNYPVFVALGLLTVSAVILAMSDKKLAENFAIYAYYFLVIGITIRFFELVLPDHTRERLSNAKMHISNWMKQHLI